MKVMCIAYELDGDWLLSSTNRACIGPNYGEVCTVIGKDKYGYLLSEYPVGEGYPPDCFIPISNIDETEIAKEREQQTVNI